MDRLFTTEIDAFLVSQRALAVLGTEIHGDIVLEGWGETGLVDLDQDRVLDLRGVCHGW